jgi:hypothetical protein
MSDPITALLSSVRDQPPPSAFVPVEAVRRRARQRARRQLIALTVMIMLVTGVAVSGTFFWLGRPGPGPATHPTVVPSGSGSLPASPPPSSAGVSSVLLQASDLGPGDWRTSTYHPEGMRSWWDRQPCPAYRGGHASLGHQVSSTRVSYVNGSARVTELVETYQSGWAVRNLDETRAIVAACKRVGTPKPDANGVAPVLYTILDTGQDFLVVRQEDFGFNPDNSISPMLIQLIVVFRVGDQAVTVVLPEGSDPDAIREKATARLR